jgi:predicted dehydrogenase
VTVRIAAVGYGDIAQRRHFPQLAELAGRAELVAIAGRDEARMAACAARFGVPRWSTDVASVVGDTGVDAVLVLTAPDTHLQFAEMAVAAGKHVLVEKPLVPTLEEAARLAAAVRARPVTFMALPFIETPDHVLAAGLIARGAIGEVAAMECHRGHKGPTHAGWFYDKAQAGGGVLADLGIYHLTSIAMLFGGASRFTVSLSTRFAERVLDDGTVVRPDVEDSALVSLVLESGVAASMHAHWNGSQPHTATRARARVLVIGREGSLYFGAPDGMVHLWRPGGDGARFGGEAGVFDSLPVQSFQTVGGPAQIMRAFVERIEAGDVSTRSLDVQAHVLEIIARSYEGGAQPIEPKTRVVMG